MDKKNALQNELENIKNGVGAKFDFGKAQWSLLPWDDVEQIVRVLEFGAKKYTPENWKKLPKGKKRCWVLCNCFDY